MGMVSRRIVAGVLLACLAGGARAAELQVWTQSVGDKVQPTTKPTSADSIALEGARDSYEATQVIVHAVGGVLSKVTMAASDLTDGAGHAIAKANIAFFREDFIDFTGVTATGGNRPVRRTPRPATGGSRTR